jgi:uncharacterized iron-regulated membrane protein
MNKSSQNRSLDLHIIDLAEFGRLKSLSVKQTVCLVASDSLAKGGLLTEFLEVLAGIGCKFFLTWGAAAEAIHDRLDELIEQKGGDALKIATMSQEEESVDDVVWFLLNAAIPAQEDIRYVVVIDSVLVDADLLVSAIRLSVDQAQNHRGSDEA